MDNQHRTQIPPPPPLTRPPTEPPPEPARGVFGILIGGLLGLVAWAVGLALWAGAEDADTPMANYFGSVALAVVGGTLMVVTALYDIAGRDE